jgi:hypothetical protein
MAINLPLHGQDWNTNREIDTRQLKLQKGDF